MRKQITIILSILLIALSIDAMQVRRGIVSPLLVNHSQIQQEVLKLQNDFGLPVTPTRTVHGFVTIRGTQGTQQQFNGVRSQLNMLLASIDPLTKDRVAQIIQLIDQLKNLNPARWPQPKTYEDLLSAKLAKERSATLTQTTVTAAAAATIPASVTPSTPVVIPDHATIQNQFITLSAQYGIVIPEMRKREMKSILGVQRADQAGFNKIRFELYILLSKSTLTQDDITQIKNKISDLRTANPARWPQPEDYETLLNFRTRP